MKCIDLRTSVDPVTGERITPEEYLARGHNGHGPSMINDAWEAREGIDYAEIASAHQVISDIQPYKPIASDIGGQKIIGGRRQHREFLRRNGYAEVGNERVTPRREELPRADRVNDIRRAMRDV